MYYLLKAISIPARSLLRISPSPQVYNQQLSVSQMHKQSFVLLHWFFQVSEKEKKNRSAGRDFVLVSIRFFSPHSVQSKHHDPGRSSSQVRTWAIDNSVIIDHLKKKTLSSRKSAAKHSTEWHNCIPHLFHSAGRLSVWPLYPSCCRERQNCQLSIG